MLLVALNPKRMNKAIDIASLLAKKKLGGKAKRMNIEIF